MITLSAGFPTRFLSEKIKNDCGVKRQVGSDVLHSTTTIYCSYEWKTWTEGYIRCKARGGEANLPLPGFPFTLRCRKTRAWCEIGSSRCTTSSPVWLPKCWCHPWSLEKASLYPNQIRARTNHVRSRLWDGGRGYDGSVHGAERYPFGKILSNAKDKQPGKSIRLKLYPAIFSC